MRLGLEVPATLLHKGVDGGVFLAGAARFWRPRPSLFYGFDSPASLSAQSITVRILNLTKK
ncbi:MAG: hypothetical protein ABGY42_06300 [bacterium]